MYSVTFLRWKQRQVCNTTITSHQKSLPEPYPLPNIIHCWRLSSACYIGLLCKHLPGVFAFWTKYTVKNNSQEHASSSRESQKVKNQDKTKTVLYISYFSSGHPLSVFFLPSASSPLLFLKSLKLKEKRRVVSLVQFAFRWGMSLLILLFKNKLLAPSGEHQLINPDV